MVRLEQTSDSFPTDDWSVSLAVGLPLGWEQNRVAQSLVGPVKLMMLDVFRHGVSQRYFTKEDHPIKALLFDRPNESFGEGVQVRTSGRQFDRFDAHALKDHVTAGCELPAAIADEISTLRQNTAAVAGQVPGSLPHPRIVGVGRNPSQVNFAAADVNEEQNVVRHQAEGSPDFGGEEVGSQQTVSVRLNEVGSGGLGLALRGGVEAVDFEDVLYGLMATIMAGQCGCGSLPCERRLVGGDRGVHVLSTATGRYRTSAEH